MAGFSFTGTLNWRKASLERRISPNLILTTHGDSNVITQGCSWWLSQLTLLYVQDQFELCVSVWPGLRFGFCRMYHNKTREVSVASQKLMTQSIRYGTNRA
jgi:hypothetical protein